MALSIKIWKKVGGRSEMIASRSWPQNRISIGRGEECTLVLEDPKKHISRVHVELEEKDGGRFHLTIVSKVNPVFVNGKKQAPGGGVDLAAGDRLELGEYELELLSPPSPSRKVEAQTTAAEETTRPGSPQLQVPKNMAPPPAPSPSPAPQSAVFAEATFIGQKIPQPDAAPLDGQELPPVEPFLFDGQELPPVEPGLFDEPAAEAMPPTPTAPAAPKMPAAAPEPAPDVFAEATYVGSSSAAPNVFDEATYVGGKPPQAGAVPAAARPAAGASGTAQSVFDEATYVGGRPPQEGAVPAAVRPGGGATGMRAAVTVFLEGAGLPGKEIRDAEIEEFLRQAGKIMRASIEGSMALLAARATAKKELRAEDRTMVASKDNNPLKLMSDPQEALAFLFDTKDRTDGFLDPVKAVGDAFEDLRAHEVALFAAMRAALLGTIQRFDPKMLEAELEKSAGGLGLNRKAKLWELFAAYQQKLARDAEDDFNKVFGREFMGTYMAQVKRLRGGG